jgi:hypothetical protein
MDALCTFSWPLSYTTEAFSDEEALRRQLSLELRARAYRNIVVRSNAPLDFGQDNLPQRQETFRKSFEQEHEDERAIKTWRNRSVPRLNKARFTPRRDQRPSGTQWQAGSHQSC